MMNDQYLNIPMPNNINPYQNLVHDYDNTDKPDVDKFMHDYNDKHRKKFNPYWFQRNDDWNTK